MQNSANTLAKLDMISNTQHLTRNLRLHTQLFTSTNSKQNTPLPVHNSNNNTTSDYILKRNGYTINIVNSLKQQIKTNTFIKNMYSAKGYLTESATTFYNDPNQITFQACKGKTIIGTLSLRIDSHNGLLADELYQSEIDKFRQEGRKVCELSKLAVDSELNTHEIIASMFQCTVIYARTHNVKNFICEVNPRHAGSQKRMFGFSQIGELRTCPRVDAPAVLLHLTSDYVANQIANLDNSPKSRRKSLYTYFLSQQEEMRLTNNIINKLITNHNPTSQIQPSKREAVS